MKSNFPPSVRHRQLLMRLNIDRENMPTWPDFHRGWWDGASDWRATLKAGSQTMLGPLEKDQREYDNGFAAGMKAAERVARERSETERGERRSKRLPPG